MSVSDWCARNTTLRNKPFSIKGYEFQRQILDDMHPNLWCEKISQVGLSELQIRKMLAFLERNQGTTGIFSLPDQPVRDRFAKTRVKPLVDGDEVFNKERDKNATRSALLYQLGQSFLHLSDCTEGSATSTSADILLHDEIDLSDQSMLALFGSRLQHSSWKVRQFFSTPTHVSFGIDAGFASTDQNEYLCRCAACGHWQLPDFTRQFVIMPGLPDEIACFSEIEEHHTHEIDIGGAFVHCEKCFRPLDLSDPELREWVPTYPSRTLARGYRVRPFSTSQLSISYIIQELLTYKRLSFIRGWWNTVMGRAFTGGNERLAVADIEACLDSPQMPDLPEGEPISVGIDSGIMCHVTLFKGADPLNSPIFSMEVVHSERLVEHITMLAKRYRIVTGGMDRHPQTVLANQVLAASGGKIWPIEYRGSQELHPIKDPTGENTIYFQCDRTALLDKVQTRVRGHNLKMAGFGIQKQVIINHLTNMVRDEKPKEPARWCKLSEDDHYFHSIGFGITSSVIAEYISNSSNSDVRQVVSLIGVNAQKINNLLNTKNTIANGPLG
ncbi:phage terminase large subunit family protein [Telmatospirillum sp.]|uniref:phage terminase large subunit family protein n=1 Tax=Telmatospirillum sp. TaxID=2079197 RepID=UPI00283C0753|nr:phage terminase large subunit family protein [Telmatospirillum sp.]MDR3436423.1 phage terminase large subunit family protein [Telmatospirillum sp.]